MSDEQILRRLRRIAERSPGLPDEHRELLDRRRFFAAGGTSLAAFLAACNSGGPAKADRLLRYAERTNEGVERLLLSHRSMNHGSAGARLAGAEFPVYFVSPAMPVWDPAQQGPWALEVGGLVRQPLRLTLDELMRLPRTAHRVDHFCVEGWNAVAQWTGVRMTELARMAGVLPAAQYVDFQSFDNGYHESWDLESALHPQTLIAYGMDGHLLGAAHGAPARLHSPVKLGYKNTKYLTRVMFMPERNGGYWSDQGYEWYGGA